MYKFIDGTKVVFEKGKVSRIDSLDDFGILAASFDPENGYSESSAYKKMACYLNGSSFSGYRSC